MGLLARGGVAAALWTLLALLSTTALLTAPLWRLAGAGRSHRSASALSRRLLPALWFLSAGTLLALRPVPFACRSTV
jgi:hypothetical protein